MDLLTTVSIFFDNDYILFSTLIFLYLITSYFFKTQRKKFPKLILTLLIGFLILIAVKEIFTYPRPCVTDESLISCPESYSFPSGHALTILIFAIVLIGEPSFFIFFIFALFICYTRVFLGVHTPLDIAGSLGFAFLSYAISDVIIRKVGKKCEK